MSLDRQKTAVSAAVWKSDGVNRLVPITLYDRKEMEKEKDGKTVVLLADPKVVDYTIEAKELVKFAMLTGHYRFARAVAENKGQWEAFLALVLRGKVYRQIDIAAARCGLDESRKLLKSDLISNSSKPEAELVIALTS